MKTVEELRSNLKIAERNLRFANLRRQWLERRLIEAPNEQEFSSLLAELSALEDKTADLGIDALRARAAWAQAEDEARAAARIVQS